MITSKEYSLIGTRKFTACIIAGIYNGEYTQNDTVEVSDWLDSREEAQAWAVQALERYKPLLRTSNDEDDKPIDTEYFAEVNHWEWRDCSTPGIRDAEQIAIDHQEGYPNDDDLIEWAEPFKA